jgi:hypothetical protein
MKVSPCPAEEASGHGTRDHDYGGNGDLPSTRNTEMGVGVSSFEYGPEKKPRTSKAEVRATRSP